MGVNRYIDLVVWQLANEFKQRILELVQSSSAARRNFKFVEQIESAASAATKHITEGFLRFNPREFCRFLDYAISSVGEAEDWVRDGIDRGYFASNDCDPVFRLARRVSKGAIRLKAAQVRYIQKQKEQKQKLDPRDK